MATDQGEEQRRARFEALARELIDPLRRYLARRTDPATADDVLSDALLVCWRRLDDVPDNALPWAYGVARNCLANAERGERRRERLVARLSVVAPPEQVAAPDDRDGELLEAMAALRPEDAELLRLWAWEQLTSAEIATVLQVSANAASIRLHRAREKLREELRKIQQVAGHEQSREGRGS
ncbi:sigma-70 family RNA polymerase sigma factor [Nocardioides sp.]|uniref:RNA polymerase sigma factor n=1 Tax=Nocardioides sp. TaxID=35761 RepID=UPI002D8019A5|nr:sigma-70 family RNA polymerase sigma factor [Nocardioides sp.]HET8961553.1 sigma-70 family RNA polymerase sigma factor [Nocardioides sp.]